MLNFKKIEIEDIDIIKPILRKNNEISCENSFVNQFVWQGLYNSMFAIKDDILYIKSVEHKKDIYRLPIGVNIEKGLTEIIADCDFHLPDFWNPKDDSFKNLPDWFYEKYDFHEMPNTFDYIYLQSNLSTLSGKKYHSKRNHISQFSKAFNWRYEKITDKNLPLVLECANKWYSENTHRRDKYMDCEQQGVELMLNNMERLEIIGGAIFVENEVVAFTLGSEISSIAFDVHIEKALSDFSAAYTVINKEFASNELRKYKYINREDDMGIEGLRKAKLSYNPEIILKKYYFTPKEGAKYEH